MAHAPGTPRAARRSPARSEDLDAFREHLARTVEFTERLAESRCRRTDHFDARLGETLGVFKPLFAPWNMEIAFLLHMRGPMRFNALRRALSPERAETGMSARVLTDKLRHLEEQGIVHRDAAEASVTYALTPRGHLVARLVHPLVFFLHNEDAVVALPGADAAASAPEGVRGDG